MSIGGGEGNYGDYQVKSYRIKKPVIEINATE